MALHVVVGKGPVGTTTARLLADQGETVRVVSRSGGPAAGGVEHVALDATDAAALASASRGAAAVYNCANPSYSRWPLDWPPLAGALLSAAEANDAVLVTMGNLYGYGPVDRPMTEDLPLAATGVKGRVRARMWEDMLAAHRAGRVRVTEARASDFYGPGVTDHGHLSRVLPRLLRGRGVRVFGDPDAPHSWTYVPDVARALVRLGGDERAWGRAWHVPSPPPLSQREMIERTCRLAGLDSVRVRPMSQWLLGVAGLALPDVRELAEVRHQFDRPFVLDSSAYTATFGEAATPVDEALAATLAWWRERLAPAGGASSVAA